VYLSNAVARERIEAASDMNGHYSRMKHFQIAVTIIGAITTVLIGIKSMSNNNTTAYFIVGLLAMTFSSVGTAASALNAFYRPREAYNESQKNLSLLKQLHVEIAVAVNSAADGENCLKMTDKNDGTVKQWTKRLATILSSSGAAAQSEVKGPDENPQINSPAVPPTTTAGLQVEH
jgi:hypothetical protein